MGRSLQQLQLQDRPSWLPLCHQRRRPLEKEIEPLSENGLRLPHGNLEQSPFHPVAHPYEIALFTLSKPSDEDALYPPQDSEDVAILIYAQGSDLYVSQRSETDTLFVLQRSEAGRFRVPQRHDAETIRNRRLVLCRQVPAKKYDFH